MKKVKIMLVSLLVVAAVGGALAFKVKSTIGIFCGTTTDYCQTLHTGCLRPANPGDDPIFNLYCTDNSQIPQVCVSVTNCF